MNPKSIVNQKVIIQPVYVQLLHNEVFMGPCRYGKGNDLTYAEELRLAKERLDYFDEDMKENIDSEYAIVLDTKFMEWNEDFIIKKERLDKVLDNENDVDMYLFSGGMISYIAALIAEKTGKPIAFCPATGWSFPRLGGIDTAAYLKSRGFKEVYNAINFDDMNKIVKAYSVKKALKNTKILYAIRNNVLSIGCVSSFLNLSDITDKFGVDIVNFNSLELFKELDNLSDEENKEAEVLCNSLINEANSVHVPVSDMKNDCRFYIAVNKILDRFECNAFTLPCFELCATKELNKRHFMFCLTHSLLKDDGISSACASDIGSIISLEILMVLSKKSPHMGNCMIRLNDMKDNRMQILHDVCTRYMKGYDATPLPVDYVSYTKGNWGTTMRYDFAKDTGETITMINISPDMRKIMIGKGNVEGCEGYMTPECTHAVVFSVNDSRRFYEKESEVGHHFAWVYGDYVDDLVEFAKLMELEVLLEA